MVARHNEIIHLKPVYNNAYCIDLKNQLNFFKKHLDRTNNEVYLMNPKKEEVFINLNVINFNNIYFKINKEYNEKC
jgi:hypothetical protein